MGKEFDTVVSKPGVPGAGVSTSAEAGSQEKATSVWFDLVARRPVVVRTEHLTPRLRRIVLGGADLDGFPAGRFTPDDHVKVFFPDPETGKILLSDIGPDNSWDDGDGGRPTYRDYTVRGYDADARELTVDMVLHSHGLGGRWAAQASPGQVLGILGPRVSTVYPVDYAAYVLAADETALPALVRWIEELPPTARILAFVEVTDASDEVDLPERDGVSVHWLHRGASPAGSTTLIADALRETQLPAEPYFVWAAGEATSLRPVRRYFRTELALPKDRVAIDGYWKRGIVNLDHHDEDDAS